MAQAPALTQFLIVVLAAGSVASTIAASESGDTHPCEFKGEDFLDHHRREPSRAKV